MGKSFTGGSIIIDEHSVPLCEDEGGYYHYTVQKVYISDDKLGDLIIEGHCPQCWKHFQMTLASYLKDNGHCLSCRPA